MRKSFATYTVGLCLGINLILFNGCSSEPPEQTADTGNRKKTQEVVQSVKTSQEGIVEAAGSVSLTPSQSASLAALPQAEIGEVFRFPGREDEAADITITAKQRLKSGSTRITGQIGDSVVYGMTLVVGERGTFGRVQTPHTTYQVTTENGEIKIVDLNSEGNALAPHTDKDAIIPPGKAADDVAVSSDSAETTSAPVTASDDVATGPTIDVMVLYTPGMVENYPGSLLLERIEYLIATANSSYVKSGINASLRLVHTALVDYSDTTANSTALTLLTNGTSPFGSVSTLRNLHGADVTVLLRYYDYDTHGGCGVAWILGNNGSFSGYSGYAYAVVSDGQEQVGNVYYYCSDLSLTHEVGHNLGTTHDRANAGSAAPAYAYGYGYGISGSFGTIMSYINPETDVFSNPNLNCGTDASPQPCGIYNTSDHSSDAYNVLAINNSAAAIADYVDAKYSADVNSSGAVDLTDVILSLQIAAGMTPTATIDTYQDINDDAKIGVEEAIYGMRQLAQ